MASHHLLEPPPLGQATGLSLMPDSLVEEGTVQGPRGEERYSKDGDGVLPGCDLGIECSPTGYPMRDPVSLHSVAAHQCH
jgi:hypothetical protein